MEYRRFGRTEKKLSVITLGGMRYHDGWSKPRDEPHRELIEHCMRTVQCALDEGINHIETAHGYGKSEYAHGAAFAELGLKRDSFFLMTKGSADTADEMKRVFEEQLTGLRTDFIDLYGYHGINNQEILDRTLKKGGPLEVLEDYQRQGVIGNLGFSTHGPTDVICRAVESDRFDFMNVHYYYFWQRNYAAVQLAQARDMGVFIISPNDKGGHLFNPPPLLRKLTAPLTPIQFNARFCLRLPYVHTLSFGMTEPAHFDEMLGIFPTSSPFSTDELAIQHRLDARLSVDPLSAYEGYDMIGDPSGINIPEVLRFRRMLKCYDMEAFGKYRYNMFDAKGHWFWGAFATPENVAKVDERRVLPGVPLKEMLTETHDALFLPKEPRRSQRTLWTSGGDHWRSDRLRDWLSRYSSGRRLVAGCSIRRSSGWQFWIYRRRRGNRFWCRGGTRCRCVCGDCARARRRPGRGAGSRTGRWPRKRGRWTEVLGIGGSAHRRVSLWCGLRWVRFSG